MQTIAVRDSRNSSVKTKFHAILLVANGFYITSVCQVTENVL